MMQSAQDLLSSLHSRGVHIWAENGELRFQVRRGKMLPEDRNRLRLLKAEIIELLEQAQLGSEIPLEPRAAGCLVPLTSGQLHAWNYYKEHGRLSWRMCITSARVFGPLDSTLLRNSIEAVVWRHESLRTRFVEDNGVPRQQIDAACEQRLEVIDLSETSSADIEKHVKRLADEFVEEKIDLSAGPLFSALLFRLSRSEHVLVFALDHMISDRESNAILGKEIWTLYNQAAEGMPFILPRLYVQFADYAVWQQKTYSAWLKKHEAYWRQRMSGAPLIQLPTDARLKRVENPIGVRLQIPLGESLSVRLRDVARREKTLLAIVVLTVYVAVLSRWCNQRDFIVNFCSNGRNRPELANMIGCLTGILRLRIETTVEDCVLDLLQRVKLEFYAALDHHDLEWVPDIIPECVTDIGVNWVSTNIGSTGLELGDSGRVRIEPFPCYRKALPFRFGSYFFDSPTGIIWSVEYRPDLFSESTIERFGRNLRSFAEELAQRPLARVGAIPMEI